MLCTNQYSVILFSLQIARHYKQINEFWESSSEEIKSVYSKKYLNNQIDLIDQLREKLAANSSDAVIDAMFDAVSSSAPEYRYAVHGGPYPVDPIAVILQYNHSITV
jgi:hypothetical protein